MHLPYAARSGHPLAKQQLYFGLYQNASAPFDKTVM